MEVSIGTVIISALGIAYVVTAFFVLEKECFFFVMLGMGLLTLASNVL